jgi:tetratricopeptide (TPR) repeat protein
VVDRSQGRYDDALDYFGQALTICRAIGDRQGEAGSLYGIGDCNRAQGCVDEALDHYRQALTIFEELGNESGAQSCADGIAACEQALAEAARRARRRVFVSYRRDDTRHAVGRLVERLQVALGDDADVFYDVASIHAGVDFAARIRDALAGVDVVFAVIGPTWDPARLHLEGDFVRMELAEALTGGARLVPVLVDGASMPAAATLPGDLAALPTRNAARLRSDPDFATDAEQIVEIARSGLAPNPT